MKIKLLPSVAGSESQRQPLTSFLIDGRLAIDAGSLGFALAPDELANIRDIVITHAHSDHTASLPIFVAEAFVTQSNPINIYSTAEVVAVLRSFVFNDQVWPNFERIGLADGQILSVAFHTIRPRQAFEAASLRITPVPVNHVVPTVGLIVQDEHAAVVFTSDTHVTEEIWRAAGRIENLKAVFADVSYPNEMDDLALAAKHLTPRLLGSELEKLGRRNVEVYAVHIKPTNRDRVIEQLAAIQPAVVAAEIGRTYEW